MFKIKSPRAFQVVRDKMKEDISEDMMLRIKIELLGVKGYYDNIGDSFAFDSTDSQVRSALWSAAIVNQGRMPGTYAPHNKIVEWVLKYKAPGASPAVASKIAYKVNRKLFVEGIEPNWYMDEVLIDMENESEK